MKNLIKKQKNIVVIGKGEFAKMLDKKGINYNKKQRAKVDFLYIDKGSGYLEIKALLDEAVKLVKRSGFIGLHDFNNKKYKVLHKAATDWCNDNGYGAKIWHSFYSPEYEITDYSMLIQVR